MVVQTNSSNNIIISVWDFYGYEVIKYNDDYLKVEDYYDVNENNKKTVQEDGYGYLNISQINGTIISRYYGY